MVRQVKLLPRAKTPVKFSLNEPTPTVFASFQVDSGIDLTFDRVVTEVWTGQRVACGVMANRTRIPKHSTAGQIPSLRVALTPAAIEQIHKPLQQHQPPLQLTYNLYGREFFDWKLGSFGIQLVGHEGELEA